MGAKDYAGAEAALRRAAEAGEQLLGGRDPDHADTLVLLADAVAQQGEGRKAEVEELRRRALELFVQVTIGCGGEGERGVG